jgi:hypothetical protein
MFFISCRYLRFALSCSLIGGLSAQNNWIRLTVVRVKPEMIREWRNTYKNQVIPGYKRGGVPSFAVWRTSPFGDNYEFLMMSRMANLGQFDGGDPLWKAMATVDRRRTAITLDKCVAGVSSIGLLAQPDISVMKQGIPLPPLILFQTVSVSPRNISSYLTFLRNEVKPVIEKAGVEIWLVYRHVFGSDGYQITTVRSLKNYAELDTGPLAAQVLGPQEAVILAAKNDQLVESSRIVVGQYEQDLSYGPMF